jgi:IPT/TIG domain
MEGESEVETMMQFGRHVIKRAAGIGVGVALLVLGLAAPAYAASTPTFVPSHGPAGTDVTISGTFTLPVSSVKFNGIPAFSIPSANATTIHAIVPAAATTGPIAVTDAAGTSTSASNFTVDPLPPPTITSISPNSGCAGSTVTIYGTHLIGTNGVTFTSGKTATFTIVSDSQVTATVPSGATTGSITVTTTAAAGGGGTATSGTFTISSTCPTITSFAPTSGAVGTVVTITGTNFTGVTSVKFNGVPTAFTFNSSTQITATVPTGATTGKITVTTPSGTATSVTDFVVGGAPTITSFTPTSGPVGTVVRITGTNFTGATAVKFNGVSATFTVNSGTKITATVPTGATTGKISVTTPAGTTTSATNFTVAAVHARSVTLHLSDSLNAAGHVAVVDGFAACRSAVSVKIQRRVNGVWTTIHKATTTDTGNYAGHLKNKHGEYRTLAPKITLNSGTDVCKKAVSSVRTH